MDGRVCGVRGRMEKSIRDFLKPILPKFKLKLTDLLIHTVNSAPHQLIDHDKPLSVLNRKKVLLRTTQEYSGLYLINRKHGTINRPKQKPLIHSRF